MRSILATLVIALFAVLSSGQIARTIERPAVQNDLRQLAIFYKACQAEFGRVKSVEQFKNYIKRDAPKLYRALEKGVYVIVPNVKAGSNNVVAYERAPDSAGQHIVAMGDATIRTMTTAQLQAALKGQ
jgi:hypothetical protein